jgi:acyl-CoA synthetase (AMP-forming)/AMP-acid ligase II
MTEAGAAYCVMPPGESLKRKGSVGMPLPPAEIKIMGEDGEAVPTNEQGELMIRNPGRPREYYNDPDATAAVWEADGWLHTGDIAHLDDDGFLYIVGRMKDVIIRGGNNIHASDVEDVLHEHPGVLEVAVIGVHHEVLGEDLAAVVVTKEGQGASAEELEAFCRERLADYKVPRRYEFMDELPRNATGKVLKRDLVTRYGDA